jgi:TRAP-type C4-dicarboxylate transport system permease small subunit
MFEKFSKLFKRWLACLCVFVVLLVGAVFVYVAGTLAIIAWPFWHELSVALFATGAFVAVPTVVGGYVGTRSFLRV